MEFIDKDFVGMQCNVHKIPSNKKCVKEIAGLSKIEAINDLGTEHKNIPTDTIVRYIAYMYDVGTPLKSIPELMIRKRIAADLAGLPKDGNRFTKEAEDIIISSDEKVNDAITGFVISFNSPIYTELVAFEQAQYVYLRRIMNGSVDLKEIDLGDKLKDKIIDLRSQLLNNDNAPQLAESIYKAVSAESLGLRPEDIASKIQNNDNPVDIHPYGEDYKFEKHPWKGKKLLEDTQNTEK